MTDHQEEMHQNDDDDNNDDDRSGSSSSSFSGSDGHLSPSETALAILKKRKLIAEAESSLKKLEDRHESHTVKTSLLVDASFFWTYRYYPQRKRNSKDFILNSLRSSKIPKELTWGEYNCSRFPKRIDDDREIFLARLKHVPGLEKFRLGLSFHIPKKLRSDKEVMMEVCKIHSRGLAIASKSLKNNREVVLAAITNDPTAIEYASEKMQNNRKIARALLSREKGIVAFKYLSKQLQEDAKLAHIALLNAGEDYAKGNEHLKDLPALFREDFDIVLDSVKLRGSNLRLVTDNDLLRDMEIVYEACKQNGSSLQYVPDCPARTAMLEGDNLLMLLTNGGGGQLLEKAPSKYRFDPKYVLPAVQNGYVDKSISSFYQSPNSRDFFFKVIAASNNIRGLYKALPKELRSNHDIVLAVLKNGQIGNSFALELIQEHGNPIDTMESLMEVIGNRCLSILEDVGENGKGDKEFFLKLCEVDGSCLHYASDELKKDDDCLLLALNSKKPITLDLVDKLPTEIWEKTAIVERIIDLAAEQTISRDLIKHRITFDMLRTKRSIYLKCLDLGWPRHHLKDVAVTNSWIFDHEVMMARMRSQVKYDQRVAYRDAVRACSTREEMKEAIAIDPRVLHWSNAYARKDWLFDYEVMLVAISSSRTALQAYNHRGNDMEKVLEFASKVRERKMVADGFLQFLMGISLTSLREPQSLQPPKKRSRRGARRGSNTTRKQEKMTCNLSLLNFGGVTGATLKRAIAEYADIPIGREHKILGDALDNLSFWGY